MHLNCCHHRHRHQTGSRQNYLQNQHCCHRIHWIQNLHQTLLNCCQNHPTKTRSHHSLLPPTGFHHLQMTSQIPQNLHHGRRSCLSHHCQIHYCLRSRPRLCHHHCLACSLLRAAPQMIYHYMRSSLRSIDEFRRSSPCYYRVVPVSRGIQRFLYRDQRSSQNLQIHLLLPRNPLTLRTLLSVSLILILSLILQIHRSFQKKTSIQNLHCSNRNLHCCCFRILPNYLHRIYSSQSSPRNH
mmetsp:Transcript_6479/g.9963  ORF Transcript_6479/g.9963 Transcript_6479/m.9963 type:complete len:240 (+) Transcript_6479:154-873(+)